MRTKIFLVVFLFVTLTIVASAQNKSVYTDMSDAKCKTVESDPNEGGSYRGICGGVGGYKIEVLEGDLRQTVNLIAPGGKKFELKLWHISTAFSAVGDKAEWRMRKGKPVAVIIRFNVNDNGEDTSKTTSKLLVAKITATQACVTDVVEPSKGQNLTARKLADALASRKCLPTE